MPMSNTAYTLGENGEIVRISGLYARGADGNACQIKFAEYTEQSETDAIKDDIVDLKLRVEDLENKTAIIDGGLI
jgi:hypothetical protein